MCGIIGVNLFNITLKDIDFVKNLFIQSKIRGQHATGLTFLKNKYLITEKKSVSADAFLKDFDLNQIIDDNSIKLIGHCRYSTSDIEYNQPIYIDKVSMVHNGVITQADYNEWNNLFNMDFETKNDTEILFKYSLINKNPIKSFPDSSQAVITLNNEGTICCWRNGKRPLYLMVVTNGFIIASTKDILLRSLNSNIYKSIELIKPGLLYKFKDNDNQLTNLIDNIEDLQL